MPTSKSCYFNVLGSVSKIVADTADRHLLKTLNSQDVTTNPTLVLKALSSSDSFNTLKLVAVNGNLSMPERLDRLLVTMGCSLLEHVPGRVSTEVDPRLSFDSEATAQRARNLSAMFQSEGVPAERVLIKIAATWEGIQAAKQLESEGISTNLTLVFSFFQAVACAQAHVQLISPFVGRIYDWHKKAAGAAWDEAANSGIHDPGVKSVHAIYNYFKHFNFPTEIMGASFRNLGQILALSGCDLLTISPDLLNQLADYEQTQKLEFSDARPFRNTISPPVFPSLSVEAAKAMKLQPIDFDEASFRWTLNEDAMATEKLAEGIRAFAADTRKLEALIQSYE